jgi:hypothetical protein
MQKILYRLTRRCIGVVQCLMKNTPLRLGKKHFINGDTKRCVITHKNTEKIRENELELLSDNLSEIFLF